jgi:hypothetical protein
MQSIKGISLFSAICMALVLIACNMGLGPTVDLEPPTLEVNGITLGSGDTINPSRIANGGDPLYVSPSFTLTGEAWDNIGVTRIVAEEIETDGTIIKRWNNASIGGRDASGKQAWSLAISDIKEGERTIRITAYDQNNNTGVKSVRQFTVLVDLTPPFVEKVTIERRAGGYVDLQKKEALEGKNPDKFTDIDYFQNGAFYIRAEIKKDFGQLRDVKLNLLDENGKQIIEELPPISDSSLYAPKWIIQAEDLIDKDQNRKSGKHYLRVTIEASDMAGQKNTDQFLWLCWYPEADAPHIVFANEAEGKIYAQKETPIPVELFDDDNLQEAYIGVLKLDEWEAVAGSSDQDKINEIIENESSRPTALKHDKFTPLERRKVLSVDSPSEGGEFRLIALVLDKKGNDPDDAPDIWTGRAVPLIITDNEIPVIMIDDPPENTAPTLEEKTGNNSTFIFSIKGTVLSMSGARVFRIAWIPAGANNNANSRVAEAEQALKQGQVAGGIKVWDIQQPSDEVLTIIDSKEFKTQTFTQTFDIFTEFGNEKEKAKLFMAYTLDNQGHEVFRTFRLLGYTTPPSIDIIEPKNMGYYGKGASIDFVLSADFPNNIPITSAKLEDITDITNGREISLTRSGNSWTAADTRSAEGLAVYRFTVMDCMGNEAVQQRNIVISALPGLQSIGTPHSDNSVFNANIEKNENKITLTAYFSDAVTVSGTPRIRLSGFADNIERYAEYTGGAGSSSLTFVYTVQAGDSSSGLIIPLEKPIDLNNGHIGAELPGYNGTPAWNPSDGKTFDSATDSTKKTLKIDGIAPKIIGVDISPASGWYKAGERLTVEVTLSEEAMVLGAPQFILKGDGNSTFNAGFQTTKNNGKTLVFSYMVTTGDTAEPVQYNESSCFSADNVKLITDKAGNQLALKTGAALTLTIVNLDTTEPPAPTLTQVTAHRSYRIERDNIETHPGTKVQYTLNEMTHGWVDVTSPLPYTIPDITVDGTYKVAARQIDRAGNISKLNTEYEFTLGNPCSLLSVVCENPDGTYPKDAPLTFKLIFSGKVHTNGTTNAKITLEDGTGSLDVPVTAVQQGSNADYFLYFPWTIPADKIMNPVKITAIDLTDVVSEAGATPSADLNSVKNAYNRPNLKVRSKAPVIVNTNPVMAGNESSAGVLALPNNGKSIITLTFDTKVYPETGKITIKPVGNWLIPPVLTNEEFYKVQSAVSTADQAVLTNTSTGYVKTTHGLMESNNTYVPDISTKYVLHFSQGLDNAALRPVFERAKYLWQEIDVTTGQVTGEGTDTITITMDALPDGRVWGVEVSAGAFRDDAGNTFAGWTNANAHRFWSDKVAKPVIRVERISHNNATTAPATRTRFRIDCETPGAEVKYGTIENKVSTITDITDSMTNPAKYSFGTSGAYNSDKADAAVSELSGLAATLSYTPPAGTFPTIGDGNLYTARKDYIKATATRNNVSGYPNLAASDAGYEGAFKTLLVYRVTRTASDATIDSSTGFPRRWVKFEGANIYGGQPTIPGFPLSNNDMSGTKSKYAYPQVVVPGSTGNGNLPTDWIWITWEIVSEWYQVGLKIDNNTPDTPFVNAQWTDDAWVHTPRTYGNFGLSVLDANSSPGSGF